jgi:hypothetical protein
MKATEANLLSFLKKSPQFVIPIYQRTYSWTEKECRQLWQDIVRTGNNDEVSAHFVGSIVYIEKGLYQVSDQAPLLVIDGQQRLTTVTLILAALAEAVGDTEPVEGFSRRKLRNYYLVNPEEEGERHHKLILSQTDKPSLIAVVGGNEQPIDRSIRVTENYELFRTLLRASNGDLAPVCRGLAKLVVVDVALSRGQDNPQLIFESMNSTGRELSQADLIRNFILMGLEPDLQTKLYEQYWRPMEVDFGQEAYGVYFDAFHAPLPHSEDGRDPQPAGGLRGIQAARTPFRRRSGRSRGAGEGDPRLRALLLRHGARCRKRPELRLAFQDLRELRVDVAYPFLLELYHDYAGGTLSQAEFVEVVRPHRVVRLPARRLRHPYQLAQQDFLHLWARAQEGSLPGEHPGAPAAPTVVPPLSRGRRVPACAGNARPLQLRLATQLLAAEAGEPRTQGARPGRRVHHEHILPRTRPVARVAPGTGSGMGARTADLASYARQPDPHGVQLRVQRPTFP